MAPFRNLDMAPFRNLDMTTFLTFIVRMRWEYRKNFTAMQTRPQHFLSPCV